jgi:protein SCO1/2
MPLRLLLLVLAFTAAWPATAERMEPLPKQLEGVGITEHPGAQVPLDLEFVADDGKPVRLRSYFDGKKPVILNLGYYRCPMLCGLVLSGLLQGLKETAWSVGREFEVVTVSIDPLETPTLARLKKESYMAEYGRPGAAAGWHFLTGREENIRKLADAVGFGYRYVPERGEYAHAAVLFMATPDGHIARYLYGVLYAAGTLRMALTEAGQGKVGTTADRILLTCFHYDAEQGRYVVAAMTLMRTGGGVTVLVVGGWLLARWRRDARKPRERSEERPT